MYSPKFKNGITLSTKIEVIISNFGNDNVVNSLLILPYVAKVQSTDWF